MQRKQTIIHYLHMHGMNVQQGCSTPTPPEGIILVLQRRLGEVLLENSSVCTYFQAIFNIHLCFLSIAFKDTFL